MPNDKVKIYRNSARKQQTAVRQYVPQYQLLGIEPEEIRSASIPGNVLIARASATDSDNPRTRRPSIRQPYAESVDSPIGRGKSLVPNVGNNMEHTWASVDQEVIDDISGQTVNIDPNHQMIDNNDIVDPVVMEVQDNLSQDDVVEQKSFLTEEELQGAINKDTPADLSSLEDGSYILLVNGVIVSIASEEEIQELASAFVFGEHELCDGQPVPVENIIVLKKVKIKTGLFLE